MDDFGLLVLRVVVGLTFAAHGAQKVFGWWGGPGMAGWRGAMERMYFRPATLFAALSSGSELIGGLLLALGFLIPFVVAALIAQSLVIIALAHWPKGFFNTNGGFEFPLALAAVVTALAATGPGGISLDAALGIGFAPALRLELFLLGILGGVIALAISRLAVRSAVPAAR